MSACVQAKESVMRDYLVFTSVLLVSLIGCAGIALPYPILAPLFMDGQTNGLNSYLGLPTEMLLGIALAIYPLGILIGASFIGALSDSYGRKKVLVWTLFISIIGYLISAYAIVTENYLLFVLSRFFTGLCEGNVSIARAIALDLGETIDKTRAMSLINASTFIGWFIGPLAGGYLAVYGNDVAFLAGAIAIAFCMVLAMATIKETHQVENDKPFLSLLRTQNSFYLLKQASVRQVFVLQLVFTMGLNAFYEFYPVWLVAAQDYVAKDIGEITASMTVCMTLTSLLLVTWLKRLVGIKAAMVGALSSCAIVMLILPFTSQQSMVLLFALTGCCIAVYNGLLPVYLSDNHQDEGNGALMGLLTATFCISNTIMALVGSYALTFGPQVPMFMGSGFIALAVLILVRYLYFINTKHSQPSSLASI
jgi:predicted MFS family arabinose efflux permease